MNWDHLRYFIAAAERGSFSAAAKVLKADTATVSRHIAALEDQLGVQLFQRHRNGLIPTAAGERLTLRAKRIEQEVFELNGEFELADHELHGRIVITATETLAIPLLIPALSKLLAENPNLAVTLRTDYRSLNLSRREADIALRMVRPKQGNLLIRKVGEMGFGLYAHASYLNAAPRLEKESDLIDHRLLDWAEDYPLVSVIGWLRRRVKLDDSHFNADSAFARIAGAKAGMGIALLPHVLAKMHRELQRVASHIRIPNADIWLVTHKDSAKIPRIRAAMEFVTEAIRENQMSLTGD